MSICRMIQEVLGSATEEIAEVGSVPVKVAGNREMNADEAVAVALAMEPVNYNVETDVVMVVACEIV